MGLIKRALKRTTRKILAKLVPPIMQPSQQLVLNPSLEAGNVIPSPTDEHVLVGGKRNSLVRLKLSRRFKRRTSSSKDTTVAEALLLAVKNHLPPVQFHHVHGPNVRLGKSKCVARRTQSFCQALVFSNRVILPNERVYIRVLEIAKGWSGTIRFGFTAVDPATLACSMPKHACPDMTNAGHTWARALADEVVRRNSVIHFSYNKSGLIHYGINNQDCGVFHANVSTNQNLWLIVDIYGLTAAIELIDPRVNGAPGADGGALSSSTIYKSTSAMSEIFGQFNDGVSQLEPTVGRNRRKQSRKHAARQLQQQQAAAAAAATASGLYGNPIATNYLGLSFNPATQQYTPSSGMQLLPNLNSISLPSAQQNIYSPMPSNRRANDTHDYHQISLNNTCPVVGMYQPIDRANSRLNPSVSVANVCRRPAQSTSTSSSSLSSLANASSGSFSSSSGNIDSINSSHDEQQQQHDLSRRLDNLRLLERRSRQQQPQQQQQRQRQRSMPAKSSRSTSLLAARTPLGGAARTRLDRSSQGPNEKQNQKRTSTSMSMQTDYTSDKSTNHRTPGSSSSTTTTTTNTRSKVSPSSLLTQQQQQSSTNSKTTTSSNGGGASGASGSTKLKPRHSTSGQRAKSISVASSSDRDKSNNGSVGKDCPICFERPINCVLYQCGHMCTCYECGVKQWKTESRTCPICRTIIKDVIKTYMS